jgi:tetratricopeptide (TPR) repeat protein
MFHNRQMLIYAAMMSGQAKLAIRAADELVSQIPPGIPEMFGDEIASIQVMPFDARKRFGKWRELLALPDFPAKFPAARALRAADRAVAYAALGQIAPARQELKLFAKYRSMVKPGGQPLLLNSVRQLLPIAEHFALGEVLTQEGNVAGGLSELRLAVKAEDQLRYDEPPTWLQPVRHTLGAALVRAHRYEESLDVFNTDLVRHPHNGWSMYGKYQSLMGIQRVSEAGAALAEFKKVWRQADHPIDSACLCLKPL